MWVQKALLRGGGGGEGRQLRGQSEGRVGTDRGGAPGAGVPGQHRAWRIPLPSPARLSPTSLSVSLMSPQPVTQQSFRFLNSEEEDTMQMGWTCLLKVTGEESLISAMSCCDFLLNWGNVIISWTPYRRRKARRLQMDGVEDSSPNWTDHSEG